MPPPPDRPEDPALPGQWPHRARPLFTPAATTLFRVAILGGLLFLTGLGVTVYGFYHSPYWDDIGIAPPQPVLFSHRHHVGELGIDCRNCHSGVETSAFAGLPPTQTCLSCHSQIFTTTSLLKPVVDSAVSNSPLVWTRVTRLPDHVYFNHSIHVNKGVGCTSCHGDIAHMAVTAKGEPMSMRWCLDCHKNPGPQLRPRSEEFSGNLPAGPADPAKAAALLAFYQIHPGHLTDCSTCHH